MVVKEKARLKNNVQDNDKDLVKSIVDMLWDYNEIKRAVNNNYVVLNAIVRNVVKSLGINGNNFDLQSFMDNFDIHEMDLMTQDTLADSLTKVLSRFIITKADNNVDVAMEMAPSMIESRLREIIGYLRNNPHDAETIDYAKELINQLKLFDRGLASKYSRELENIISPKPEPKPMVKIVEPKPMVKVIESENVIKFKAEPKAEPKARVKVSVGRERKLKEIDSIVYGMRKSRKRKVLGLLEQYEIYIEKLRKEYERERKRKSRERKVMIRHASYKITDYFDTKETENADNNKRGWKRYVKGILKWIAIIGMV